MSEIDLTKNQIIESDIKVWVWDYEDKSDATERNLQYIDHRAEYPFHCWIPKTNHINAFKHASITDPRIEVKFPTIRCKNDIKELDEDVWWVGCNDTGEPRKYEKPSSLWGTAKSTWYWIKHLPTGQTMQCPPDLPYELPKQKRPMELWEIPKFLKDNPDLVLIKIMHNDVHINTPVSTVCNPKYLYIISADKLASLGRMPRIEDCEPLEVEE